MVTSAALTVAVAARIPREMRDELDHLARSTGRTRNVLFEEALRRLIAVERWQIADVEAGLREADAGDFATTEEIEAVRARHRA